MKICLAVATAAIVLQGCGGRLQGDEPPEEEPDAAVADAAGSGEGGTAPVTLSNGCTLCNDDGLCNFCLIQMSDTTWRCPVAAGPPSAACWTVGEVHGTDGKLFTCYYC